MDLHWITEAAQKPQNLDDQLYEAAIHKAQPYSVAIYDGAQHDPEASERDGRMRYRSAPMIAIRILGETDFTSQPLTDDHKRRFPRAWDIYSKRREQWANTLPLTLLPGLSEADRLELEHLGITDIDALAQSAEMPENLEPLRLLARRVRKPHVRMTASGPVPA